MRSKLLIVMFMSLAAGSLITMIVLNGSISAQAVGKESNDIAISHPVSHTEYFSKAAQGAGIPKVLQLPIGNVSPLVDAKNQVDIIAWAEGNTITRHSRFTSVWTQQPATQWLVLMHTSKSGTVAWMVYLYAYHPSCDKDNRPWKLAFVGESSDIDGLYTLESVYIDSSNESLVLADRNGKSLSHFRIAKVLRWIDVK